jgi:hypothetical protein
VIEIEEAKGSADGFFGNDIAKQIQAEKITELVGQRAIHLMNLINKVPVGKLIPSRHPFGTT